MRLPKRSRESFQVSFEDFLTATIYELVSAPSTVESALESEARDVMVVLKRVVDHEKLQQIRSQLLPKQQGTASPLASADASEPVRTPEESSQSLSSSAGVTSPCQRRKLALAAITNAQTACKLL